MNYLEIRKRLSAFRVGIAGCGGLGSNCAVALSRVGIGSLIIIDFDKVEESNLNRQYYFQHQIGMYKAKALYDNIKLIGSPTNVDYHIKQIDKTNAPMLFQNCNIVVEAFDRADQKLMLIESLMSGGNDFRLIAGVGMAGWGDTESISIHRHDKLIICGDMKTEANEQLSPLAPRVGIVANMQANTVLELLLGKMSEYGNNIE